MKEIYINIKKIKKMFNIILLDIQEINPYH